jgi:hypothetical protein
MVESIRETYIVAFPQEMVECKSWEDANALESARDVLTDLLGNEPSLEDCDQLFGLPLEYRRLDLPAEMTPPVAPPMPNLVESATPMPVGV